MAWCAELVGLRAVSRIAMVRVYGKAWCRVIIPTAMVSSLVSLVTVYTHYPKSWSRKSSSSGAVNTIFFPLGWPVASPRAC